MPLIDIRCVPVSGLDDDAHTHEYHRPLAEWPATPPCPTCGAPTVQVHLPKTVSHFTDPIVAFRMPDGSYRFPGEADGRSARTYAAQGGERIEMKTFADVRRFEDRVNAHERLLAGQRLEGRLAAQEARLSATRRELRQRMTAMTAAGRDLARAAMAQGDAKPRTYTRDPGVYVEVMSHYRGNRDAARDAQGRRRRD